VTNYTKCLSLGRGQIEKDEKWPAFNENELDATYNPATLCKNSHLYLVLQACLVKHILGLIKPS